MACGKECADPEIIPAGYVAIDAARGEQRGPGLEIVSWCKRVVGWLHLFQRPVGGACVGGGAPLVDLSKLNVLHVTRSRRLLGSMPWLLLVQSLSLYL